MTPLILFDFDGTLADSAPDLAAAANRQRDDRRLAPLPYEELRPYASQGARGLIGAALGLKPGDESYEATRARFLQDYAQNMFVHTRLFAGIPELLRTLDTRGWPWGIVTNKIESLTWPMVRHLGLKDRCRVVVCGDTTAHPKPHPAPLLHAAEQAAFNPSACLYIGDDARDIQAGKAAGMATLAAAYGYCSLNDPMTWEADMIAHTTDELWPLIEQWAEGPPPLPMRAGLDQAQTLR